MATGSSVVSSAFFRAGIRAAETTITSDELTNGFDLLVDLLNEWQLSGLPLGFVQSAEISDDLGIVKEAESAAKWNLAVRINAAYQRPIPPGLIEMADSSYRAMLNAMNIVGTTSMPGNLPIGSGNDDDNDFFERKFYPPSQDKNF